MSFLKGRLNRQRQSYELRCLDVDLRFIISSPRRYLIQVGFFICSFFKKIQFNSKEGKKTHMGCPLLLIQIFETQIVNPGLEPWQPTLRRLSRVAIITKPFSRPKSPFYPKATSGKACQITGMLSEYRNWTLIVGCKLDCFWINSQSCIH